MLDSFGRPIPDVAKYPSSAGGKGFGPLVAEMGKLGIKLGLWIIRGVPVEAAAQNMPIAGSNLFAKDAVRWAVCLQQRAMWFFIGSL